ncbi:DinB family protein [Halalkalibacterium ligniniphilum]|uniref:DinB family protein n=1 Tax=Halalkalibacterium ligniniphilum TaxID=1134413 RepID=UPI00034D909F|nr:DinB family protein [Halalkalibacterium ligniniphilum]
MAYISVESSIESIQQSLDRIIETTKELSEETIRWKPSEEEWSIIQIVCHLVEAVPYWLNEIEGLLKSPGKEWGRGLQDEARLAAVSETDSQSISTIINDLEALKSKVEQGLGVLDEDKLKLEAPSRNPRFGTKPISFIVDHLLVEHVSKHESQIKRNLLKLK